MQREVYGQAIWARMRIKGTEYLGNFHDDMKLRLDISCVRVTGI